MTPGFEARWRKMQAWLTAIALLFLLCYPVAAQKKSRTKVVPKPPDQLVRLREEFIAKTNEYKSSLGRLQTLLAKDVTKAEEKLAAVRKLFEEGLIARAQVEETERALATAKDKLAETERQMAAADTQVAELLIEAKAAEEISKSVRLAKGGLLRTTAMIHYQGTGGWNLGDAWKVQRFFSDSFKKPLPIAVFGQGSIHDRWRLDHRNAMDISLHPDGVEGQALMSFLQKNGIPFLAFREAIPGTATGPHIHIGRPSHRY
ncbi:MAG TPA: hypothetical protein VLA93_21310 [Pyrinomonadaceae bacterium]|nr:hypothetical protein [Pyrinomonadaceae bacterium]